MDTAPESWGVGCDGAGLGQAPGWVRGVRIRQTPGKVPARLEQSPGELRAVPPEWGWSPWARGAGPGSHGPARSMHFSLRAHRCLWEHGGLLCKGSRVRVGRLGSGPTYISEL